MAKKTAPNEPKPYDLDALIAQQEALVASMEEPPPATLARLEELRAQRERS